MAALPPDIEASTSVAAPFFGMYQQENDFPKYEVNAAGIFLHSLAIHSISRDTLRESSTFSVKGDYIYGIKENDSLPCVLEGDSYYFGVPTKEMILGATSPNVLKQLNKNEYLLNFQQEGKFIPCKLQFGNMQLKISYFDYVNGENKALDFVKKKQEIIDASLTTVLLLPTQKEWKKMLELGIFGETLLFKIR